MGIYLPSVDVELKILLTFHQAVRVAEITVFLKQLCCLTVVLINGVSKGEICLQYSCCRWGIVTFLLFCSSNKIV